MGDIPIGLVHRCKSYLLNKKGQPFKKLNHIVMISADQLKWLVEKAGISHEVYGTPQDSGRERDDNED